MIWEVDAYTVFNTVRKFTVGTLDKAREYATRITREGLWYVEEEGQEEVFLPAHQIVKVKIKRSG